MLPKVQGWSYDPDFAAELEVAHIALQAGAISTAAFDRARSARLEHNDVTEVTACLDAVSSIANDAGVSQKCLQLLDNFPHIDAFSLFPNRLRRVARWARARGKYALSEKLYRQAVDRCYLTFPVDMIGSRLELADLLVSSGRPDEGCTLYADVTRRWGSAKNSISAKAAALAMSRHCTKKEYK
jgi:hypothetical protein